MDMETQPISCNVDIEAPLTIRFLLFPSGKEIVRPFDPKITFEQVKRQLLEYWPDDFEKVQSIEQLKFIRSGGVIGNDKTISEVIKSESTSSGPTTIHIFIKKEVSSSPVPSIPSHTSASASSSIPEDGPIDPRDLHFHATLFGEDEETTCLRQIFDKKKGQDGKIELVELYKFLRTYWKFLGDQRHVDPNRPFPAKRFVTLKKKYVGDAERITREQFVTIYFLIDSKASRNPCPQGIKEHVQRAAVELHQSLNPPMEWSQERFENLFRRIDKNEDGALSCREYDLFLYLYTLEVSDPMLLAS